jgi:serine/threonine protein kinase
VYLDKFESKDIALKVADVAKQGHMLKELLNEVSIYEKLVELQGNGIPIFFFHGYVEEILYCIAVSTCGTVPKFLNDHQKGMLIDTLDQIHRAGILHNDIRVENILVDESGKPSIIDFGFASLGSSLIDQAKEKEELLDLIRTL